MKILLKKMLEFVPVILLLSIDLYAQIPDKSTQPALKIAMLQMPSRGEQEWNLEKGTEMCRMAKSMGADMALFPEMVNIGYQGVDFEEPDALEQWKAKAIAPDGDFVRHFRDLAKELEMAIVLTYLEQTGSLPKNTASLIDREGNIVLCYSKVHTVDPFPVETAIMPGNDFYVVDLDTRLGPVKVGIMICYDREFPESARILMLKGAELILTPNACGLDSLRLRQFQIRAWENAVATAMCNYAGNGNNGLNGHSCAYSPEGKELLMAGDQEGIYLVRVDLQKVREYREKTYWGNAYRRPHRYHKLTSPEVKPPFIRKDGFGRKFERLKR